MPLSPPQALVPRPIRDFIGVHTLESIGIELMGVTGGSAPADQNYPSANLAMFVPFVVQSPITVAKMWCNNGAAVAGNVDVGIYDPAGVRLISIGSTAQAGTSALQEFDITNTLLSPGTYYLGIASDTSGATQKLVSFSASFAGLYRSCGIYQMATAFPLPDPATFAVCAQTVLPRFGLTMRTLV